MEDRWHHRGGVVLLPPFPLPDPTRFDCCVSVSFAVAVVVGSAAVAVVVLAVVHAPVEHRSHSCIVHEWLELRPSLHQSIQTN